MPLPIGFGYAPIMQVRAQSGSGIDPLDSAMSATHL
jgi:hypothetical protein